jgi:amino-acid N-acetyltransferase
LVRPPRKDENMKIKDASLKDLADIKIILEESGLPAQNCEPHLTNFFVAEVDARLVGVGGLELRGVDGLVRSIAVLPAYRGRGIGRALYQRIADRAIRSGIHRLYLLTETAEDYFINLGFVPIARGDTPVTIAGTRQFRELCAQSATVMYRDVVRSGNQDETRLPANGDALHDGHNTS